MKFAKVVRYREIAAEGRGRSCRVARLRVAELRGKTARAGVVGRPLEAKRT